MVAKRFGSYTVYSDGRVWSHQGSGRWMKQRVRDASIGRGGGYIFVDLRENGVSTTWLVHRLVAKLFLPERENCEVNHKDGNRANNSVENLEWVTRSENQKHAYRKLGRSRKFKLLPSQYTEIKKRRADGEELKSIAKDFNITFQSVSRICLEDIGCAA